MSFLLGGLAAGLGLGSMRLLGSYISNRANQRNAEWSAREQDRMSWEHWNAQNAYNHPKEQMRRLREAGLNPLLVYGGGHVSGNSASQAVVPNVSTPDTNYDTSGFLDGIMAYQNLANMDSQKQLNDAQTQYTLARAEKVRQDMSMDFFNRQNPARSADVPGLFDRFRSYAKNVASIGGAGLVLKNLYDRTLGKGPNYRKALSSSPVNATVRNISKPGIFSRIGSRVGSWLGKLGKGSWIYQLLRPQPLAPF